MNKRDVPRKYEVLYSKRNSSRKAAIRSFCLECCGYNDNEVRLCPSNGCPLYHWRSPGNTSYNKRGTKDYQEWRKIILDKYDNKCCMCNSDKDLDVHHVVPVSVDISKITDPENGIVLCRNCHRKLHHPSR